MQLLPPSVTLISIKGGILTIVPSYQNYAKSLFAAGWFLKHGWFYTPLHANLRLPYAKPSAMEGRLAKMDGLHSSTHLVNWINTYTVKLISEQARNTLLTLGLVVSELVRMTVVAVMKDAYPTHQQGQTRTTTPAEHLHSASVRRTRGCIILIYGIDRG